MTEAVAGRVADPGFGLRMTQKHRHAAGGEFGPQPFRAPISARREWRSERANEQAPAR
jgi:hypothetical protein